MRVRRNPFLETEVIISAQVFYAATVYLRILQKGQVQVLSIHRLPQGVPGAEHHRGMRTGHEFKRVAWKLGRAICLLVKRTGRGVPVDQAGQALARSSIWLTSLRKGHKRKGVSKVSVAERRAQHFSLTALVNRHCELYERLTRT